MAGYAGQIARAFYLRTAGSSQPAIVQAAIRLWYNPGRSSKKFFGPGIFVLGLSMFPPLLASLAMAKEGEQKTILQVYVSSISAHEFLLGKILAFMAVALAECLLMLIAPSYMGALFTPGPWLVLPVAAVLGIVMGSLVINKLVAIEV